MFNPAIFANLAPMVYRIKRDPNDKDNYFLIKEMDRFIIPKKLYGKLEKYKNHFWNYFITSDSSLGILLTGDAGTGKTELAKTIGNKAIESGVPVILISDLDGNLKLIEFLNSINYALIIFDEFGKMFPTFIQEKMLTFLSDVNYSKKMFILTENHKNYISEFIRNRPGRVRYHIHFGKLEWDTIVEYCKDKNVSEKFINELKEIYKKTVIFSFDHLNSLVTEHLLFPNNSLEELLEVLNLDIFTKEIYIEIYSIKDKENPDEELLEEKRSITKEDFKNNYCITCSIKKNNSFCVKKENLISNIGENYIFEYDNYIILAKETTEPSKTGNNTRGMNFL